MTSMIDVVVREIIPVTMRLLPIGMDSPAARAMLVAIGLQESRFIHRRQIKGPARGFLQFERGGGVRGVLTHPATAQTARQLADTLCYPADEHTLYAALEHNDVLALAFGRLLLWTLPGRLPGPQEPVEGWRQYMESWRPGKPHEGTWQAFYAEAWTRVEPNQRLT